MKGNPDGAEDGKGLLIDGYRRQSKRGKSKKDDSANPDGIGGGMCDRMTEKRKTTKGLLGGSFPTIHPYDSCPEGGNVSTSGTSIFDPVLCELAYRWFCPENGIVLDPFAGGSVRGIVASKLNRQYIGIELRSEQVTANREQADHICADDPTPPVWHIGDSRTIGKLAAGTEADFVFSCPPYADLEVYSDNPQDISTLNYPEFLKAYEVIISETLTLLKPDRFACFVVGDVRDKKGFYYNFVGDTISIFQDCGATLYNEAILVTVAGSLPIRVGKQFGRYRKLGKTHQNVLVFFNGNPKNIPDVLGEVQIDNECFARAEAELNSDDPAAQFGEIL